MSGEHFLKANWDRSNLIDLSVNGPIDEDLV